MRASVGTVCGFDLSEFDIFTEVCVTLLLLIFFMSSRWAYMQCHYTGAAGEIRNILFGLHLGVV